MQCSGMEQPEQHLTLRGEVGIGAEIEGSRGKKGQRLEEGGAGKLQGEEVGKAEVGRGPTYRFPCWGAEFKTTLQYLDALPGKLQQIDKFSIYKVYWGGGVSLS